VIAELDIFKSVGGKTIIEGTAEDYGRDPLKLEKAARQSGINVVATAGFYLHEYHPEWVDTSDEQFIAEHLTKEITEGIGETGIRAGQIKCSVSNKFIHRNEAKVLRAAAIAQKITGSPIWLHHGGMRGVETLRILDDAGADLSKVVLGHMDRNPDPYEYRKIAEMGSIMSLDNFARVHRYPIQTNVDMLKELLDLGYIDRLLLSADFGRTTYLESFGGGPGFRYLLTDLSERLRDELGLTQPEIDKFFIDNPAKVYAVF
jgi:phosphotriesterase-related protein